MTKAVSIKDVVDRLAEIREAAVNDEAHQLEDKLFSDVLQSIADGTAEDPREMARLAISSLEIDFHRWYA